MTLTDRTRCPAGPASIFVGQSETTGYVGWHGSRPSERTWRDLRCHTLRYYAAVALRTCTVSFVDYRGVRHSVDVTAETLYEAAAAGVALLKREEWGEPIAPGTPLDVEVRAPSLMHRLTLAQIQQWCDGVAVSPDEVIGRQRVKALIE